MKRISALLPFLLVAGCGAFTDYTVHRVSPTAQFDEMEKTNQKLVVVISDKIPNQVAVPSTGLKTATFTELRESLKDGFRNSFGDYFTEIEFSGQKSAKGYTIEMTRADPKGNKVSRGSDGSSEINFTLRYHEVLYKDGKKVSSAKGTVASTETTRYVRRKDTTPVFQNAMGNMFEDMGGKLFNPEK